MSVALLIEFAAGSRFEREPELAPRSAALSIIGNGPPGSFVRFADGRRVPLPTDQIVSAEDAGGAARVGFGGMRFVGLQGAVLVFLRVRDLLPESQLSPERGRRMTLVPDMVASIVADDQFVWPARH